VKATQKKSWCQENFLHFRNLEYAVNVKKQLTALAEKAKLESSSCENNTENLRRALFEGLSENLAELQRDQSYVAVIIIFFFQIHF
jgi:ATP-dependent RNA helicase DHX33